MSTTVSPIILSDTLGPGFTFETADKALVAMITADPRMRDGFRLVAAPYADVRMQDIARYAVVTDDGWDGSDRVIGRVVQCGPRTWEAFTADAGHSFGQFRTADIAGAYIMWSVER